MGGVCVQCGHSAHSARTARAQCAHYRGKLGIFATIGNIPASVDHTTPYNVAQPDVSTPPPPPHAIHGPGLQPEQRSKRRGAVRARLPRITQRLLKLRGTTCTETVHPVQCLAARPHELLRADLPDSPTDSKGTPKTRPEVAARHTHTVTEQSHVGGSKRQVCHDTQLGVSVS